MGGLRHVWYQAIWLSLYWIAAACSLVFLALALLGGGVAAESLFAVAAGAVATTLGASMATHLLLRRVSDADFDDATGLMRVVVVGWLLLSLTLVLGVVAATDWGATASVGAEARRSMLAIADSVVGELFGAAALFVVVGDGFGRYRQLLAKPPPLPPSPRHPLPGAQRGPIPAQRDGRTVVQ